MNVYDIVKKYLIDNGYDGLYTDDCGCLVDDLMPCSGCGDIINCQAGYRASGKDLVEVGLPTDDFIVWDKKPEEGEDGKE